MRARLLTPILAAALAIAPATPVDAGAATPSQRAKQLRLAKFGDCSELVAFARRNARRVEPYYYAADILTVVPPAPGQEATGPAPQAAPGGGDQPDSSSTNVQERGVDEPDTVKTDGDTIFSIVDDTLHAVDARTPQPRLTGSLKLPGFGHQLLIHGRRALVMGVVATFAPGPPVGAASSLPYWGFDTATVLTEVDISDPADLKVIRTETIDGFFVSARLTGDTARVVVSSPPAALEPGVADTVERRVAGWVPASTVADRRTGRERRRRIVRCGAVRRPRTFSGLDMLTVLTIDLSRGLPAIDADALMTSAETVYASAGSLYVATHRWTPPAESAGQALPRGRTAIHRFDTSDPRRTAYRASGAVPGYVLSQWSLSEHRGVLRVASTQEPDWWTGTQREESESFVTTLAERDGALAEVGRVGGLGRGERIYAVRMIGDTGYVVTFRQVDPLYTIDLSVPESPRVAGELKILGYSAYLHPLADDLLLGVGQDATDEGRTLGTQLSIFDVSDLANPQRIHQLRLAQGSSEAEFDHHAFLYWEPRKLAVIPLAVHRPAGPAFLGAAGFEVDRAAGIREVGRVSHDWGPAAVAVSRSVVVGDRLFTVSPLGVAASDLATFADRGHVAFPQAQGPEPVRSPGGSP